MEMELWDAYRKDGSLAGCDLRRDQPIPAGLFHLVSQVLVRHTDGTYLLMQRDWNKDGFPGLFEAGASGSVLKDETAIQGAMRELKEETGICADDLMFVFALSNMKDAIFYCYLCVTDCPKDSIVLQKGETISYRWLDKKEFIDFMNSSDFVLVQRERWEPYLNHI